MVPIILAAASVNATMRLTLPTGPLTALFDPTGTPNSIYSFHCFTLDDTGKPTFVHGTAQTYWYFEGPINSDRVATTQLYAVNTFTRAHIRATLTIQYSSDFTAAAVSVSGCNDPQCELWPTTLFDGASSFGVSDAPALCLWAPDSTVVGSEGLLDRHWGGTQGSSDNCALANELMQGSYVYHLSDEECAQEGLPPNCPSVHGFIEGRVVSTDSNRGVILATWTDEFGSGANLFVAPSSTTVNGFYCSGSAGKIDYCVEEFYTLGSRQPAAELNCTANIPPPPPVSTMRLTLPTGPLTALFDPTGTPNSIYSFHCFTLDDTGKPTFVHGTAQTYWYFEGPINSDRVATTQLYAVNTFTRAHIRATLTIQYSSDFTAAAVSVSGCNDPQCELWPTTLFDGASSFGVSDAPALCLWAPDSTVVGSEGLLDRHWGGTQGSSDNCALANELMQGSYVYHLSDEECAQEGLPPNCPSVHGFIEGRVVSTDSNRGVILATWTDEFGSGANLFVAPSSTTVNGFYCSGSAGKIDYCVEEFYTLGTAANSATIAPLCTANFVHSPPPSLPPAGSGGMPNNPDPNPNYLIADDARNFKYLEATLAFVLLTFLLLVCFVVIFMRSQAGYGTIDHNAKVKMLEMTVGKSDEV